MAQTEIISESRVREVLNLAESAELQRWGDSSAIAGLSGSIVDRSYTAAEFIDAISPAFVAALCRSWLEQRDALQPDKAQVCPSCMGTGYLWPTQE